MDGFDEFFKLSESDIAQEINDWGKNLFGIASPTCFMCLSIYKSKSSHKVQSKLLDLGVKHHWKFSATKCDCMNQSG
jgi:hypothetical protein